MGGWFSSAPATTDSATQTTDDQRPSSPRTKTSKSKSIPPHYPEEILQYNPAQVKQMIQLYKEKKEAVDRSSIRGVKAKKDLYNALSKNDLPEHRSSKPRIDPESYHRKNQTNCIKAACDACSHVSHGYTWYNATDGSKTWIPWPTGRPCDHEPIYSAGSTAIIAETDHPKGYLTKVTNDYIAQHDEELTVHKGTMVKVLRNHRDGRYEVYTAGGFGLVPGKILAYIQYEPDY